MLGAGLLEDMGEKLLKGEQLPEQTAHRQRFHAALLEKDVQATVLCIQLHTDPMTRQMARDVIALEINAEHAMAINFALQMQAIERLEPAIGIDGAGQWR